MTLREKLIQLSTLGWTIEDLIKLVEALEIVTEPEFDTESYELQNDETQERKINKTIEQNVSAKIQRLGVPVHIKGYKYLKEAIIMCLKDWHNMDKVTKILYPAIAEKYGTTTKGVESSIRHAIEVVWERGDLNYIQKVFGYTVSAKKVRPTNSEFITMIVNSL